MTTNNSSEQNNVSPSEQLNNSLNEVMDVATNVVNQVITAAVLPAMEQVVPVVNEIIKGVDVDQVKNNQKEKKETNDTVKLDDVTVDTSESDEVFIKPEEEPEEKPEEKSEEKTVNKKRRKLFEFLPSVRKSSTPVKEFFKPVVENQGG